MDNSNPAGNAFTIPKELLLASYKSVLDRFDGKNVIYLSRDPFMKVYCAIYTKKGVPWQDYLSRIILRPD